MQSNEMSDTFSNVFESYISDLGTPGIETNETYKSHQHLPSEVEMNVVESREAFDSFSNVLEACISDL